MVIIRTTVSSHLTRSENISRWRMFPGWSQITEVSHSPFYWWEQKFQLGYQCGSQVINTLIFTFIISITVWTNWFNNLINFVVIQSSFWSSVARKSGTATFAWKQFKIRNIASGRGIFPNAIHRSNVFYLFRKYLNLLILVNDCYILTARSWSQRIPPENWWNQTSLGHENRRTTDRTRDQSFN